MDTIPVCVRASTITEASTVLTTCFVKWLNDLIATVYWIHTIYQLLFIYFLNQMSQQSSDAGGCVLVSKVDKRPMKLREVNHLFEISKLNFKNYLTPKHFRWTDNQMNEDISDGMSDSMKTLVVRFESHIRVRHSDSQSRLSTGSTMEI